MDEFLGVGGDFHFLCINGDGDHEIQQILPDRFKQTIIDYFNKFDSTARKQVKTVSLDLNNYYQDIARLVFPNVKIIVDRFHIVAMMTSFFNHIYKDS
nr:transposase [Pediococcus inopinatus]